MAISWDTQTSNVNVASKRADVSFTRTDSALMTPEDVFTVAFNQVILETTPQRLALLDQVWAEWQKELTKRASIEAFITNLEQLANANLDAREV